MWVDTARNRPRIQKTGHGKAMASAAQPAREIPGKELFRIGEVSRLTSTKTFVLRYWETEFPMLQPVKSPKGHRLYRREDIETVFTIKSLLYDEGFTIEGARRHLLDYAQNLLRAEATFRQIQVAFGSSGGGGGAGGGAGRDLASLFDLELDTEKNQYETAQTAGSQSQQEKDIDEALQKLDQLARRQEELAQQRNSTQ